jgi:hypothetical protein
MPTPRMAHENDGTPDARLILLEEHDRMLFGNGQPGIIKELQTAVQSIKIWQAIAVGMIILMQFLTSSGVVSLKGVLGK